MLARRVGTFLQQVGHHYDVDHGLPGNEVQAVDIAPDGTVWAGTSEGLAVLIADPRGVDESHWREIDSLSGWSLFENFRPLIAVAFIVGDAGQHIVVSHPYDLGFNVG